MRKIRRKSSLTLIEVFISLGLISIIVSAIFSMLIQTITLAKSIDSIKEHALKTSFFYDRLLHIFSHADSSTLNLDKNHPAKISFTFENGLDRTLIFSGKIGGSLYIDNQKNIVLELIAKDKKTIQKEILLSNIETINFDFHSPFFISLYVTFPNELKKEFVFFFSDRPLDKEGYPV
ncbi:MAG: type II secretion system protein [Chlamydiae bacterium]|nr:type II secretion system protein [Chlamydiota bacterium]